MQQKLIKVIAVLLTTTILYANSAAVVSYAADNFLSEKALENQGTSTTNDNVEFDVYYDGGKHTVSADVNAEDTKLNIALNVKKAGYLKDAVVQNNTITITTGYVIQMYDYIIEKSTGKVIRGSSNNKLKIVYEMKFRRTLDESAKIDKCPNCGAKIDMNTSGICEYCGSKLVSENTKWVLTEKKTIRQETI